MIHTIASKKTLLHHIVIPVFYFQGESPRAKSDEIEVCVEAKTREEAVRKVGEAISRIAEGE